MPILWRSSLPRSCIKFAFPPARVPEMPGTRERGSVKPGMHNNLCYINDYPLTLSAALRGCFERLFEGNTVGQSLRNDDIAAGHLHDLFIYEVH